MPVGVTIHGTDPTVQKVASYDELAQCLRARTPGNIDNSSTTVVQQPVSYGIRTANTSSNGWGIQEECTHTLDCAQGVAVAQPVVHAIQAGALRVNPASGPDGVGVQADHAYTLDTHATQGVAICGAFFAGQGAKAGSIAYSTDVAPTLKASDSGTNRTPSVHINTHPAVAFTTEQTPKFSDDCALTLTKQSPTGGAKFNPSCLPCKCAALRQWKVNALWDFLTATPPSHGAKSLPASARTDRATRR